MYVSPIPFHRNPVFVMIFCFCTVVAGVIQKLDQIFQALPLVPRTGRLAKRLNALNSEFLSDYGISIDSRKC